MQPQLLKVFLQVYIKWIVINKSLLVNIQMCQNKEKRRSYDITQLHHQQNMS